MKQPVITDGFYGPTDRMSQIQDFSQTTLPFILHDNVIFNAAVFLCHMLTKCRIKCQKLLHMLLQKIKKLSLRGKTRMLDRLCHTAGKLSLW